MRMRIEVDLALGKAVRFTTPQGVEHPRVITAAFNSLGIEKMSGVTSLSGKEIEWTKSELDDLGRPKAVTDAQGKELKAHLRKHWIKLSDANVEKTWPRTE